ncbi:MAG: 4-hydroxythreonine-4-phosphate dehydrogenase PdxA [Gammaproteobacteria bacterium]|nr:MAG: 4-hydroxythreonine-4-phosphate dehydrogenase PdxA [Gammaproteobacteria bacterium]
MMRLAITPGEPAGIGPDLVLALADMARASQWVVVADPKLLAERARWLELDVELIPFDPEDDSLDEPGTLRVMPIATARPVRAGILDSANARYVLSTLEQAVDGCMNGTFDGLVTGPVHKGIINDSGVPFSGHTELLAERTGTSVVLMVLAADDLRVALVTTHVPLSAVPALITEARLDRALAMFRGGLMTHFGIESPRILVAGLNPHAGEGGHLGREEIEVIEPACADARERGWDIIGPLPADTLFTPDVLYGADGVLAMYHDQGLPVLKHVGFGRAVNITFGLPIVRTSVDHGTALDLAGSGEADSGSLAAALATAEAMIERRDDRRAR